MHDINMTIVRLQFSYYWTFGFKVIVSCYFVRTIVVITVSITRIFYTGTSAICFVFGVQLLPIDTGTVLLDG